VFRRKGKGAPADDEPAVAGEQAPEQAGEASDTADSGDSGDTAGTASVQSAAVIRVEGGPYDVDSPPSDELPRLDLGSLHIPLVDGLEVRLEVDPQTGEPAQLVLADGETILQLAAFAAPRNSGIWDLVRAEIAESLVTAGGSAEEVPGAVGTELSANIPTGEPAGALAPARFLGVDGPRWFLRGLISGPGARDKEASGRLEFAFRGTIVVRGKDAMPIRDPLPLRVPQEALDAAQQAEADPAGEAPTLEQLDPGPTITETR
jgi:hypothetical protein